MAQVIVLDFDSGEATVFTYNKEEYPDVDVLLSKLEDDEKISSVENCELMTNDGKFEINFENI
jgi:cobalamin biosynthesis Co2+ chelatase CbiK